MDKAETGSGHNSEARKTTLRSVIQELIAYESEIGVIRAKIKKVMAEKVKGDLGYQRKHFDVLRYVYEQEQESRDAFVDTLREGFAALNIGQQHSFLDAIATESSSAKSEPISEPILSIAEVRGGKVFEDFDDRMAFNNGFGSAMVGDTPESHPKVWKKAKHKHLLAEWRRGFADGEKEMMMRENGAPARTVDDWYAYGEGTPEENPDFGGAEDNAPLIDEDALAAKLADEGDEFDEFGNPKP